MGKLGNESELGGCIQALIQVFFVKGVSMTLGLFFCICMPGAGPLVGQGPVDRKALVLKQAGSLQGTPDGLLQGRDIAVVDLVGIAPAQAQAQQARQVRCVVVEPVQGRAHDGEDHILDAGAADDAGGQHAIEPLHQGGRVHHFALQAALHAPEGREAGCATQVLDGVTLAIVFSLAWGGEHLPDLGLGHDGLKEFAQVAVANGHDGVTHDDQRIDKLDGYRGDFGANKGYDFLRAGFIARLGAGQLIVALAGLA